MTDLLCPGGEEKVEEGVCDGDEEEEEYEDEDDGCSDDDDDDLKWVERKCLEGVCRVGGGRETPTKSPKSSSPSSSSFSVFIVSSLLLLLLLLIILLLSVAILLVLLLVLFELKVSLEPLVLAVPPLMREVGEQKFVLLFVLRLSKVLL